MFSECDVPAFPGRFSNTFLKIVVEVMTSGLPQVCKLELGVSSSMLPVKHLAPKILMAVHGYKLAKGCGGRNLPTIKRNMQPSVLDSASIA